MKTIALLTTCGENPVTDQLMLDGYEVHEALWADEVLHRNETEQIDVVVIMEGVEDPELPGLLGKFITLKLKPDATPVDMIWELTQTVSACYAGPVGARGIIST